MRGRVAASLRWLAAVWIASGAMPGKPEVIERAGVRIEYPPEAAQLAEESLVTLETARDTYKDRLPNSPDRLSVVICSSNVEFETYAGPLATYSVLGIAQPERDRIVLKTPGIVPAGSDYSGTVRHELIHILLRHNVNVDQIPRWLNEGIAMVMSGENRWESRAYVASMYLNGRILSYRDLEISFLDPGSEVEFGDAYAQAYSMTQYLLSELGEERFWRLLHSLDSRTFGVALEAELGTVPYEFWAAWKDSLGWSAVVFSIISSFTLFQIMAVLTVVAYWRKRRRGLRVIRQWEKEDAQGEDDDDDDEDEEWADND